MILNFAVEYFHLDIETKVYINIFRWLVIVALFYFGIAFIYRYGVALKRKLPWLTPGATLATILSIISSLLFSFYVNAFNTYNQIYGSIGTIIVLMLWIQINCMVLMVGFELNASIAVNRDLKLAREEEGEDNC
jgi:membrane protein